MVKFHRKNDTRCISISFVSTGTRTATSTTEAPSRQGGALDEELLIKEAKRRHRRRLGLVGAVVVLLAVVAWGFSVLLSTSPPAKQRSPVSPQKPPATAAVASSCQQGQLSAVVAFNQSGSDLGAIKLANTSKQACTLSGRPQVSVINGTGNDLGVVESPYGRAGLPQGPTSPVVLSSSSGSPQAIVELDWQWCGSPPGTTSFDIRFSGWSSPLVIPNAAVSPAGFSPSVPDGCPNTALFAVDVVRGLYPDGVVAGTS